MAVAALAATFPLTGFASEKTEAIVKGVDGMEIPIVIYTPETGAGPFPVVFHVHGGGWNGGTETEVPGAGVGSASILCDRLGIICVGLAYRCKNQNGTFQLAMDDLQDSVAWFWERGEEFNADLSRIGFSGGSAGTPLSALMAQQVPKCKTYLGCWGVYDLMDNKESLFPDEESRALYGLASEQQALEASAFHNLRSPPPATLLLHGGKDILTHASQSLKFGKQIEAKGGQAEVIIFPDMNHNFLGLSNPAAYKKGILAISHFYQEQFDLAFNDFALLEKELDERVDGYWPASSIEDEQLLGWWKGKKETLSLLKGGQAEIINLRGKTSPATYQIEGATFEITSDGASRTFYLRRDGRAIYEILQDERRGGVKMIYNKKRKK